MTPELLSLRSLRPETQSNLRVLDVPGSCPNLLWTRIFEGTYDRPFVVDNTKVRCLHFDLDCVQSAMSLHDPYELALEYTRRMMAFLLFNPRPKRILMLGLGGGSLAKFCYRRLPSTAVTAVELSPDVIALRQHFFIPADDDRFRVLHDDAASYVASRGHKKDVILADACDRSGIAPQLNALDFYRSARRRLSRRGVFVANLCSEPFACAAHLTKIRGVFGDNVVTLRVSSLGNMIVFAFKEPTREVNWSRLTDEAVVLKRRFGLEFPRYLRRIALEWNLRRWHSASPEAFSQKCRRID